jgi:predicted transcriptional regulator
MASITMRVNSEVKKVVGVKRAITSLDRGKGIAHDDVMSWVGPWGRKRERPTPKRPAK